MQFVPLICIVLFSSVFIRMFKTDLGLKDSFNKLVKEEGAAFMTRYTLCPMHVLNADLLSITCLL